MMPPPEMRNNIDVRHMPDIFEPEDDDEQQTIEIEQEDDDDVEEDEDTHSPLALRPPSGILAKIRMIRARFIPLLAKLRHTPKRWAPPSPPSPRPIPVLRQAPVLRPRPMPSSFMEHLRMAKERQMRRSMRRAFRPPTFGPLKPLPLPSHPYHHHGFPMKPHDHQDNRFQTNMSPNNKFQLVQIFVNKGKGYKHHMMGNNPFSPRPFPSHSAPHYGFGHPFRPPTPRRGPPRMPMHMRPPPPPRHSQDYIDNNVEIEYPDDILRMRMDGSTTTAPPNLGSSVINDMFPGEEDGVERLNVGGTEFFVYNVDDKVRSEPDYVCMLPLNNGDCKSMLRRWYYNSDRGLCEVFVYGGCGGNGNRFDSYSECRATCMRKYGACHVHRTSGDVTSDNDVRWRVYDVG